MTFFREELKKVNFLEEKKILAQKHLDKLIKSSLS